MAEGDSTKTGTGRETQPPDERVPRYTLLFDAHGSWAGVPSPVALDVSSRELRLDGGDFGPRLAEIRGSEVKLSGWDESGGVDSPMTSAVHGEPSDGLRHARREVAFGDFAFAFECVVNRTRGDVIGEYIRRSKVADGQLSPLLEHDAFVTYSMISGPGDPVACLMAGLDVALAFEGRGLLGMTLDNSWRALTPKHIHSFKRVPDLPAFDLVSAFELTVNHVPLLEGDRCYWLTMGNPLWGLPEFIVPTHRALGTEGLGLSRLRALFCDAIEGRRVVSAGQTVEVAGARFAANPISALPPATARFLARSEGALVYVAEDVAPFLFDVSSESAGAGVGAPLGADPSPAGDEQIPDDLDRDLSPLLTSESPLARSEEASILTDAGAAFASRPLPEPEPASPPDIERPAPPLPAAPDLPAGRLDVPDMASALVGAFLLVARADGEYGPRQLEAFRRALAEHLAGTKEFKMVQVQLLEELDDLLSKTVDPLANIQVFRIAAQRQMSAGSAMRARKAVYFVGHDVASASSRGFLRGGLSKSQELALSELAEALGFE